MDTLRITIISFLAAFALSGRAQEKDESNAVGVDNFSSGALALRAPADMQQEATCAMTVVDLGQATGLLARPTICSDQEKSIRALWHWTTTVSRYYRNTYTSRYARLPELI